MSKHVRLRRRWRRSSSAAHAEAADPRIGAAGQTTDRRLHPAEAPRGWRLPLMFDRVAAAAETVPPARADAAAPAAAYGDAAAAERQLREAIARWREHMTAPSTPAEPIDATRDHIIGDPAAPLAVVEYGDYQCSECMAVDPLLRRAAWLEQGRVCFVFRHFPLVDAHPGALRAALAVEASAAQGHFTEMHDRLMASKPVTREDGLERIVPDARLSDAGLLGYAPDLRLDLARFQADMSDPRALAHIIDDFWSGLRSGVNGTPTFYIHGEREDVIGPEELIARLEAELTTTP